MSLHALMPPCAQTLWLRFTGTMENRSTPTPSSASLIVQASPASPPPTTITRFLDAKAISTSVRDQRLPHQLSELLALVNDELQVVFQVSDVSLQQLAK